MNYTQDSSKKEELPWVGIYIRTYNSFSTTNANFGNRKSIGFSASKKSLCKVAKVSYIDTTASLLVKHNIMHNAMYITRVYEAAFCKEEKL